jgi:hypothetical protein
MTMKSPAQPMRQLSSQTSGRWALPALLYVCVVAGVLLGGYLAKNQEKLPAQLADGTASKARTTAAPQAKVAAPRPSAIKPPKDPQPTVTAAQQELDKIRADMEELLKGQMESDASAIAAILSCPNPPAKDELAAPQREVELKLSAAQSLQQEVEKELSGPVEEQPAVSAELALAHPALGKLLQAIVASRLKVNAATANFTNDKDLQSVQDELQLNLSELRAELSRCNDSLRQQTDVLSRQLKQIAQQRKAEQAKSAALAEQAARYQVLRERLLAAEATLVKARTEASSAVAASVQEPPVAPPAEPAPEEVVSNSSSPRTQRSSPDMAWLALIGAVAGLPVPAAVMLWKRRST